MKGTSAFTPVLASRLAPAFARYVDLKRALGRRFDLPARTLQSLDRFLCDQSAEYSDLNAAAFQAWCHTHEHVTSGVRRVRMLEVRSFCLYRHRTEPPCFVPDPSFFPPYHQRLPNMPSKFATRTAWASRGASFSATRPRFPTRREIAIFTPIQVISPRFSQILSVFGDNSARDRGGKRYPAQALQSLPVIKSVT